MSTTVTKVTKLEHPEAEGGPDGKQKKGKKDKSDKKPGGKKKLILILVVVLVVAAAAWFFLLRPSGTEEPKPGEIVTLESTQINLAGGHYLKIGLALQLVEGAAEVDGSKALDATIDLYTGRTVTEVSRAKDRHDLKEQLSKTLTKDYDDAVMGVYFTEYVTQ